MEEKEYATDEDVTNEDVVVREDEEEETSEGMNPLKLLLESEEGHISTHLRKIL